MILNNCSVRFYFYCILQTAVLIVAGCNITGDMQNDLDVSLDRQPVYEFGEDAKSSQKLGAKDDIEWSDFFRKQPSSEERAKLAAKIDVELKNNVSGDYLATARRQVAMGQLAAAEISLKAAYAANHQDIMIPIELAGLMLRRNQTTSAFEYLALAKQILDDVPQIDPKTTFQYRYLLALAEMQNENVVKAKEILSDLIRVDKTFTPAYVALANIYIGAAKPAMASFILSRAQDRAKPLPSLDTAIGLVAKFSGDIEKAKRDFFKALSLDKNYGPALVNLAMIQFEQGDREAAELNLQKAVANSAADYHAFIALGNCQRQMGQNKAARLSYEYALQLNPEGADVRLDLAKLLKEDLGNTEDAIRLLKEAISLNDENVSGIAQLYLNDILAKGG